MLAEMTASDLALWQAFYRTKPDRTEHYLSQICAMLANRWRKEAGRTYSPEDFAPDLRSPMERAHAAARYAAAEAEFAALRERVIAEQQATGDGSCP